MAKIYNVIVGDKGQKSVPVATLFYDEDRKAVLSGEFCVEELKRALAEKNVTTLKGSPKGKFAGKDVVRVAGFVGGRKQADW